MNYQDGENLLLPGFIFCLFSIILIWPPDEAVSAGLTFEHLFWNWFETQSVNPIKHTLQKIVVNRVCVSCLPSLFSAYILFYLPPSPMGTGIAAVGIAIAICGLVYGWFHLYTNLKHLRHMKELAQYEGSIDDIIRVVNVEYSEFSNFSVNFSHSTRLVVGNTWVIYHNRFDMTIVAISDVSFEAVKTTTLNINLEPVNDLLQLITLQAKIAHKTIKEFSFRLRVDQFRDMRERLAAPIQVARNVILHQSLNERFVEAFIGCIESNGRYLYDRMDELEPCFGCSSETPNVKIIRKCRDTLQGYPECRSCQCRPMWCSGCLGRIFASKQNQDHPEHWLDGQASCPTCRAEFCMLDVCFIVGDPSQL